MKRGLIQSYPIRTGTPHISLVGDNRKRDSVSAVTHSVGACFDFDLTPATDFKRTSLC